MYHINNLVEKKGTPRRYLGDEGKPAGSETTQPFRLPKANLSDRQLFSSGQEASSGKM